MIALKYWRSFELGCQVFFAEVHSFFTFPTGQKIWVFVEQLIFFGCPFSFVVFVGENAVEGLDVSWYSIQFANNYGKSGSVLFGKDLKKSGEFSERHVVGGELDLGLGGDVLGVDLLVDVRKEVLDLASEFHLIK